MDLLTSLLVFCIYCYAVKGYCEKNKIPLEIGTWRHDLHHMDTASIENRPVAIIEGQVYVYENYFPNRTIKYIHIDNLARRSCGASAAIRAGGVDTSSVLIILHAEPNNEIRSVIDIWGTKNKVEKNHLPPKGFVSDQEKKSMKSLYLFKDLRAVHHNLHNP